MTDQCSDCAHAFVGEVKVDFDGPGYLDFECEMCNEGRCPYYERGEDEDDFEIPEGDGDRPETAGKLVNRMNRETVIRLADDQMKMIADAWKELRPAYLMIDGKEVSTIEVEKMLDRIPDLEDKAERFERLAKILNDAYTAFERSNPPMAINPYGRVLQKYHMTEEKE